MILLDGLHLEARGYLLEHRNLENMKLSTRRYLRKTASFSIFAMPTGLFNTVLLLRNLECVRVKI
jgi:hypothetical protein